jgi:hypothetical protein
MPSILSTKPSTPHDEVESDNFEPTHNWGWKDWQHWLVDKESGQPTEVTMKGIVAYSSLNLWSNMGSNESMDIWRLGQQSITCESIYCQTCRTLTYQIGSAGSVVFGTNSVL